MNYQRLVGLSLMLALAIGCARQEMPAEEDLKDAEAMTVETEVPDSHSSRNSLDWSGSYSGVVPCASCPGIETQVTLHDDGRFERSIKHIDEAPFPRMDSGTFTWNEAGSTVTLGADEDAQQYQVGENRLFQLDRDGKRIVGDLAAHYELEKHSQDPAIEDRRWKLIEIRGKSIESNSAVLNLSAEGAVASGNASCNTFSGGYAIKTGQRIRFDQSMAVTMMACPDMTIEAAFFEMLQQVDNYAVGEDGTLSLNRARMAPLARFVPDDA